MQSNLNVKILKLCIVEICLQIGFEKISEQSLNILTDVLKYYILQVSLKLHTTLGSDIFSDGIYEFLLSYLHVKDSYLEKELIYFLMSQNALKNNLDDLENNKSILHCLRILPKDQNFTGVARSNIHEIDLEQNIKPSFINIDLHKDEVLKTFINKCKDQIATSKKLEVYDYDLINLLQNEKPNIMFSDNNKGSHGMQYETAEVFNDIDDIFLDFTISKRHKVYKNTQ